MRITTVLASFVSFALAGVAACGGGGPKPVAIPGAAADGGTAGDAGSSPFATTPPPSGLPPMAQMPPPGVVGSKKGKRRPDAALYACGARERASGKDPLALVKRIGEGCAFASKMKPMGAPFRGQQSDRDPHAEHRFRVSAGTCYRVYVATDEGIKDAVAVVRDSAGEIVAESNGHAAVPPDGAMCFTASDEATLMVGVGAGKGTYAAQVWSE